MSTETAPLELMITVQDMDTIRLDTSSGLSAFGSVDLPPLHRQLVSVFEHWLGMDQVTRQEELEVLGSLLFQSLFSGEVFRIYEQLRSQASRSQRLRVQLSFQKDAFEIASYPWEFLYVPETETRRGYFMATEPSIVLSRYMPFETTRGGQLAPTEGELIILVVVSGPQNLPPVIAPPVIEAIQGLGKENPIQVVIEKAPTVDRFLQALEDHHPHVLHFLGHGQFDQTDREGEIALLDDEERNARWVRDKLFAEYFRQVEAIPRLVVLHCCEGGANQLSARFAGLAPSLIRADIPAVVAMQYPITNKAAIVFSKAFYRELIRRAPVDSAAQSGRYAMTLDPDYSYSSRVFGTPMLWMRSRSGEILPPPKLDQAGTGISGPAIPPGD